MPTTVDEIVIRESGEIILVEKTSVGTATAYSRRSINVGDDYSTESARVQSICDLVHTETYLGIPVNPNANADWNSFNAAMLSDPDFNTYYGTGLATAPAITASIPAALTQVVQNGVGSFALVFNAFCTAVLVTSTDRNDWAVLAETANLSSEFIDVLRGS